MENAAANCCDEEKREADEEEEEALSLCDLPVNLNKEENQQVEEDDVEQTQTSKTEEDFKFVSWGASLSIKPEMCAADEVFFKGQILPLRHSVSSDSAVKGFRQDSHNTSVCLSRSDSMDHGSLSRFTSVSSSTSTRSSHYSTSSSNAKPMAIKIRNNFNAHPSPKPQIRLMSKTRTPNVNSRNQRSSIWDFFSVGLVRAPEFELRDLKLRSSSSNNNNNGNRTSVSRNSSCNSSNSSSSTKNVVVNNGGAEFPKNHRDLNGGFLETRMGLLSGCACSVNAVETVPSNNLAVTKSNKNSEKDKATSNAAAIGGKKKKKQALSRHRTVEWINELSHATYVDDA
ncbi:putative Late embryoproteinsis abundant protein group 8 protein [Hibiscus syriacus]|uniref:Late embryoproteinsis abundant protein group 8 protein n=1 Tax=Hibiscus syriacus TaxID=106335 RepID=A0A6A3B150_HIBSY|nr:probable serine/threonine-protein kinase fhkD [Hibiscus syriacus]KAE8709568.1 putative Late embryoproteinsis abundant protein group 8 protein [Hibiscus syriacus]